MTELADIFTELGISQYLQDFLDQGFDTWDTILDITESDFDVLGVKLGHRRKLQRKIANSRGLSSDRALASPSRNTPSSDDRQRDEQRQAGFKSEAKEGGSGPHGAKRKYRRHPKPDENAPERPPSAYVIFSNKMREELKGRNLSFTEIAKLVGENWQNLSPAEKEPFEQQAFFAKERYNNELAEYKKTSEYREYSQYLAEFKARHSNQPQVSDLEVAKRPKLEPHQSTASSGTASSGASQHGDTPTGRLRMESSASNTKNQWPAHENQPSPQLTGMKKLSMAHGVPNSRGSPSTSSPTVLPGYRDPLFGGAQQTLAWREGVADESSVPGQQLSRLTNDSDRRSSYTGPQAAELLNPTGSLQHAHRTGQVQGHPPPLLSNEFAAGRSSASSGSTNSGTFYTPRTPIEPSLDRVLPIPSLYSQKSTGSFDSPHQLPPIRPSSLSPQTSMLGSQQSPNSTFPNRTHTIVDRPSSMAAIRGYATPNTQQIPPVDKIDGRFREYLSASSSEDDNLDPVSALLRAGEIVDRTSRNRPPS